MRAFFLALVAIASCHVPAHAAAERIEVAQLILQPNFGGGIRIGKPSRRPQSSGNSHSRPKPRPRPRPRRPGIKIPNITIKLPPARRACIGGFRRGGRCYCSRKDTRIRIPNGYRCVGKVRPPTPVNIVCINGRVSRRSCICPRGSVRKKIGRRRYVCNFIQVKPPKRPVNPPVRLVCEGGYIKTGRCRCRRGRIRQKIGTRAYTCIRIAKPQPPTYVPPKKPKTKIVTPKQPPKPKVRAPRPPKIARPRGPNRSPRLPRASVADALLDYLISNPHRPDEVMITLSAGITDAQVRQLARDFNLSQLNSTQLALTGERVQRFRITDGSTVRSVVQAMRQDVRVSAVQPNMLYRKSIVPASRKPVSGDFSNGGAPKSGGSGGGSTAPSITSLPDTSATTSAPYTAAPDTGTASAPSASAPSGGAKSPWKSTPLPVAPPPTAAMDAGLQYALKSMAAPTENDDTGGSAPVLVAVVDSGIHRNHPALKGAIANHTSVIGKRLKGSAAHGTAIAGIIAGQDTVRGVARRARLLDVQAFYRRDNQSGALETSSFMLTRGIDWAYGKGARIYNLSFAGPSDPALEKVFKAGSQRGLVFVAAAGNNGPEAAPAYPAAYPSVLAITATDVKDSLYQKANRGPYLNVAAPGVDIFVPTDDGTYGFRSGTSMAAAHASGLAALVLMRNGDYTPDALGSLFEETAEDLGPKGRDPLFGAGRLNAKRALDAVTRR